jgi:hypothetical protein
MAAKPALISPVKHIVLQLLINQKCDECKMRGGDTEGELQSHIIEHQPIKIWILYGLDFIIRCELDLEK